MYKTRLIRERSAIIKQDSYKSFFLVGDNKNLYNLTAFIFGPQDSPFEKGIFEISIRLEQNYPINPPKVRFKTKIFHPNIHFKTGEVCIDILKEKWTPA